MIAIRWWTSTRKTQFEDIETHWAGIFLFWYIPLYITTVKQVTRTI